MKVELFYDPVIPHTSVRIDGRMADDNDIFGFLYPVRSCMIQTWLTPRSSWKGLTRLLEELARGEETELVFYGRSVDYEDVKDALCGAQQIKLRFKEWDSEKDHIEILRNIDSLIDKVLAEEAKDNAVARKSGKELFPAFYDSIERERKRTFKQWNVGVKDDATFREADRSSGKCCIVDGGYLDTFEKLSGLEFLLRSMRRCPEMIVCCISDREKRSEFIKYAAQFDGLGFNIVDSFHGQLENKLFKKYGQPYLLRERRNHYTALINGMQALMKSKETLKNEKRELEANRSAGNSREIVRYELKINWLSRKKRYVDQMRELSEQKPFKKLTGTEERGR